MHRDIRKGNMSMNEELQNEMHADGIPDPRPKKQNILWRITKYTVFAISLFIYAFFILRLCTSDAPKSVTRVQWNAVAEAAYQSDPASFSVLTQEPAAFITADGKFWIANVLYLPKAKQMQVTIKFNNSTLKYLKQELAEAKNKEAIANGEIEEGEILYTAADITLPDEAFDYSLLDDRGVRYHPTSITEEKKQNYNYRVLIFDGIDMEDIYTVYADIYYVGAIDYEKTPYSSLGAWHSEMPTETRDVNKER